MSNVVLRKLKVIRCAFQGVRSGVDTWWEFFLFCLDRMLSILLGKNPRFYHKRKVKNFKGVEGYRIKDIRLPLLDEKTEDTFFWQGPFGQTCFHYCYFKDCRDEAAVERSHGATLFWRETPYAYVGDGLNVAILPGDVVIDAGSWIGDFAAYASAKGAGEVYAFEPSPPAFNYLVQTAKLNPNIYPFQEGLGDAVSEIELFVDPADAHAQCNSFLEEGSMCRDTIRVPVTTIDAFVAERGLSRVDFIKICVQGYDMHLLRGARKTLQRFAPKLSLLYCSAHSVPYSIEDAKDLIKELNPQYRVSWGGGVYNRKRLFAAVPDSYRSDLGWGA